MSSESEYRRWATVCVDLATRASVLDDRIRLLAIAEAWLNLADRVTRANSRAVHQAIGAAAAEHPLVTSALGSDHADSGRAAPSQPLDNSSPRSN